ncbi:MAG: hypothetical protein JRH01_21490 [Deltaproteobacteria bacterium]|nr:hypothetical protein [Deltaproteobacteria bacterium]MBW2397261.1 hypothetical protein [Deltaproteobacteria bacterium]
MKFPLHLALAWLLVLLGWSAAAGAGSVDPKQEREAWKESWNARIDAHKELRDHPCGDFAFDPWADAFLADCQGEGASMRSEADCKRRTDWVWERSRQCSVWQDWLLRNHQKHERSKAKEPSTRVK